MKKMIMALTIAFFTWHMGAMAQEMLKLKAKTYKYDPKSNQQFELEKDHALLSGTIKDAYGDLANEKGEIKDDLPLHNVTQADTKNLLNGENYEYILRVHRAYNQGADANPVVIKGLSDEERKRRAEIQARALDPVLYRSKAKSFSAGALNEAWRYLKAAHYLNIPELIEKYARIIEIMLSSDASMRLLQANDQEYIKMIGAMNKDRTFADLILHYIPEVWAEEHTLADHAGSVTSASFSPDGSKVVTASFDKTAKIWNTQTGVCERTLTDETYWFLSASFSPDGQKIVTALTDNTAKVWNAATGRLEHTLVGHTYWVRSASFSPDGSKIVTTSNDKTAKIWNAQTGALEHTLAGHTGGVGSASFSPDGSKIVTASYDKTARIWNAQTGALERILAGHAGEINSASFSPDGNKIVTGSHDGTAKIWNARTGVCECTLAGHTAWVKSASFSPDGSKIVTASNDKTAKIWNAQTGALEHTLVGHTGGVYSASFSPDGSKIVTASDDKTAKIWALLPARTMEQALFLQYLQFIKNQGGQPGWMNGWGRRVMDTFEPDEKALIKKVFPKTLMQRSVMQTIRSYLNFGSSSSSPSASSNNNNNN